uniref:Uncharacterized protein n=1 Tax=Anguilla anguilla TaxID=7936 RepID=A0A0E9R2M1_ANGAN
MTLLINSSPTQKLVSRLKGHR